MSALLDQLLKLLDVRVFHYDGAMASYCDFSNILMSNIYTNSICNCNKKAKKSL